MSNKAIYIPKGSAREYAAFACNFYTGCSNGCDYCYLKRFPALAGSQPKLRKAFRSEAYALAQFNRDLHDSQGNIREELKREGVTFSFTTDPMLPECVELTTAAIYSCLENNVPAIVLTKRTDWVYGNKSKTILSHPKAKELLAIGFTITGLDDMEQYSDNNRSRIEALQHLNGNGYLTYVSIEPVIFYDTALKIVRECAPHTRLLKIGLKSGSRKCVDDTVDFINAVRRIVNEHGTKVYWKQSIRNCIGGGSPIGLNFVESNWNIFISNS